MKRILRDLGIMSLLCGAFYGITSAVDLMGSESDNVDVTSEFSVDRQMADKFLTKNKFELAAKHFEKLTEADPDSGHAWYLLGESYNRLRISNLRRIADERIRPNPNTQRLEEWAVQADKYGRLAVPAYEKAVDFRRFQIQSNIRLAAIHADLENIEPSLEHLSAAIESGYTSRRGIRNDWQFVNLRKHEEFAELVRRERETVRKRREYRRAYNN